MWEWFYVNNVGVVLCKKKAKQCERFCVEKVDNVGVVLCRKRKTI